MRFMTHVEVKCMTIIEWRTGGWRTGVLSSFYSMKNDELLEANMWKVQEVFVTLWATTKDIANIYLSI